MTAKKPWAGRFAGSTDAAVEAFTQSLSFDVRLYRYDIRRSIAHCRMLGKQKIIADREARSIIRGRSIRSVQRTS